MTDSNTATTTTTATVTPPADQTWWSGYDDETKGYVQNKGLATKPINEAFLSASKSHRDAERLIGAPANELLRLPKDQNAPEWDGVYKRLGALTKAEEYKFEGLKRAGEKPVGDALLDTLRKAAFAGRLSPDNAHKMAQEVVRHFDAEETGRQADEAAKLSQEQKLLKDNWGQNFEVNKFVASGAFATLTKAVGMSDTESKSTLENLAKNIGYAKVMDLFRVIGTKIGEDRFVLSSGGNNNGATMTKEAAIAEKKSLMADTAWVARYLNGGTEEARKMEGLSRIISGVAA